MAVRSATEADYIELSDDDDLTVFDEVASAPGARNGVKRRRLTEESIGEDDVGVKVEWSDESDGAYERLTKRKRGVSRRGRPRGRGGSGRRGGGRRRPVRAGSYTKAANDDSDSGRDIDDAESVDIPDYIAQRRQEFEERRAVLKEEGLRLPPDYTDIYFSEDERSVRRMTGQVRTRAPLQTRPQFDSTVRPSRPCRDVRLEYSGGVIPGPIAQYLRDYQIEGAQFLHRLFVYQRGGILGDDMGLGKTVQVAAFLAAAFGKTGDERDSKRMRKMRRAAGARATATATAGTGDMDGRWYPVVLVVCPGSLIQNWRNELERWGWWHVDLYHGPGKDDVLQAARSGRLEIMVTTYATYKNHRERINTVRWDAVVADECHVIKERQAGTTQAMDEVNALCRIGLTGTAIQNRYAELWTLLNWTNPGRFGTLAEWNHTISRPLTIGQSHDATLLQLSLARRTAKKLVQNLLPDVFLRRMKSLIAGQLPRKTDRVVFCPLTAWQTRAYENLLASDEIAFLRSVSEPCECGSGSKRGWCCHRHVPGPEPQPTWISLVFPTIQTLLKLASHLMLLVPTTEGAVSEAAATGDERHERHERAMRQLQTCVPDDWQTLYRQRDSMVNLANPELCGKWKVLRKLLRFWQASGDKVLVFSHNVRLLRMLQHLFHGTSYSVSYLDGSLGYEERQRVVDDFNRDPAQFVFLISTKAGGVGLNITSANKVVIFDPHWNPAYDLQAQDRAYRIGQVRDVDVFRLVSAGTIEEIVYARQIYKQQQANIGYRASTERRYFCGVQEDSERKGEIFGLNNLLAFHGDHVVLRDIVNKTNIAEAKAGVHLTDIDMAQAAADRENEVLVKLENQEIGAGGNGSADHHADPVQAILASAGVEYTHDNSEVVGSSHVEAQLSRRAERVLDEGEDADDPRGPAGEHHLLLADTSAAYLAGSDDEAGEHRQPRRLRYNPPGDVMRRQFCTMAREAGFATATDFALVVESWTPEQRRQCLEGFYRRREMGEKIKEEVKREDKPWIKKEKVQEVNSWIKKETKVKQEDVKPRVKESTQDVKEDGLAQNVSTTQHREVIDLLSSPLMVPVKAEPVERTNISPAADDDETDEL